MSYPKGMRVERKDNRLDKADDHGIKPRAQGTVSGRTARDPTGIECIGVLWDEPLHGERHWYSRPENLIPMDEP